MSKTSVVCLTVVGTLAVLGMLGIFLDTLKGDLATYAVQNDCIKHKVSLGIPRNEIVRTETGCKVVKRDKL